jgi:preprotein translocase subunit SecG
MSIFINFLLVIHVVVSLLIVFIVLMQRPKSEGLGAAFGGGMTDNLFGAQTTNVLQKFTRVLGGIFFALTLLLSMLYSRQARTGNQSIIQQQLTNAPAPKADAGTAPKTVNIDMSANPGATAEDVKKLLEQKLQAAKAAASASPAASAPPAASPADKPKDELDSQKFQLQTGTEKPKDGL